MPMKISQEEKSVSSRPQSITAVKPASPARGQSVRSWPLPSVNSCPGEISYQTAARLNDHGDIISR